MALTDTTRSDSAAGLDRASRGRDDARREHDLERVHHVGVELRTGAAPELLERRSLSPLRGVGTRCGHRDERVAGGDDPSPQRDLASLVTQNSSPPIRYAEPPSTTAASRLRARRASSASPAGWPKLSLYCLKPFRSKRTRSRFLPPTARGERRHDERDEQEVGQRIREVRRYGRGGPTDDVEDGLEDDGASECRERERADHAVQPEAGADLREPAMEEQREPHVARRVEREPEGIGDRRVGGDSDVARTSSQYSRPTPQRTTPRPIRPGARGARAARAIVSSPAAMMTPLNSHRRTNPSSPGPPTPTDTDRATTARSAVSARSANAETRSAASRVTMCLSPLFRMSRAGRSCIRGMPWSPRSCA